MTIKQVCEQFNISQDTLRYYEKVGVIPPVHRTSGGVRDFTETDIGWVENAVCMRNAGLSIEALIEYQRLYSQGDETIKARLELLKNQRRLLLEQKKKMEITLAHLNYKISRYEVAEKTGILNWDKPESNDD